VEAADALQGLRLPLRSPACTHSPLEEQLKATPRVSPDPASSLRELSCQCAERAACPWDCRRRASERSCNRKSAKLRSFDGVQPSNHFSFRWLGVPWSPRDALAACLTSGVCPRIATSISRFETRHNPDRSNPGQPFSLRVSAYSASLRYRSSFCFFLPLERRDHRAHTSAPPSGLPCRPRFASEPIARPWRLAVVRGGRALTARTRDQCRSWF